MAIPSPLQPSSGNIANVIPFIQTPTDIPEPSYLKPVGNLKGSGDSKATPQSGPPSKKQPQGPRGVIPKSHSDLDNDNREQAQNQEKETRDSTPPYLLNLTEKDAETLRIPDDQFKLDTWETVKKRVQENKLDEFKRVPSQLKKYLEYVWGLKQSPVYGGVQNFILRERLGWDLPDPSTSSNTADDVVVSEGKNEQLVRGSGRNGLLVNGLVNGKGSSDSARSQSPTIGSTTEPEDEEATVEYEKEIDDLFANPQEIKILQNDWPYGLDERIVHLVVWTKFPLEDDPITGDLKPDVRRQIENFVKRIFTTSNSAPNPKAPGEDSVIWFKNWTSIKSIHAVEHFHVMLFDPDPDFVDQVTGGDVPLWKKRRRSWSRQLMIGRWERCGTDTCRNWAVTTAVTTRGR